MSSLGKFSIVILLIIESVCVYAQRNINVHGTVKDVKGNPLPFCNVGVLETTFGNSTKQDGSFQFSVPSTIGSEIIIVATYVGKKSVQKKVSTLKISSISVNFMLEDLSLSLDEIIVNAERKVTNTSNSSFVFDREVIEQVQANSLADVLKLLPGKAVTNPDLQSPNILTLRTAATGTHAVNNAFGTAIIMDGSPISNNANMQAVNVSKYSSLTGTGQLSAGYGSADFANNGIDLRQIPVDNIESIEVVTGVASVKYGDMTDGAVIVNRKAGKTDWRFNSRFREGTSQFSLDKGFTLNQKLGALNLSLDYLNANNDPRDKIKSYNRVGLGLMWTVYKGKKNDFKNTLSIDYKTTLDNTRKDPDDGFETEARFNSKNISISERMDWHINKALSRNLSLNFRYSYGTQESYDQRYFNNAVRAVTAQLFTGTHEGFYIPGTYLSYRLIKGKPISAFGRIENIVSYNTKEILHTLSMGATISYSANKGEGQIIDETKPRYYNYETGDLNDRPYSFKTVPSELDYGFYIEDRFDLPIHQKPLNVRTGLRYDIQNGMANYSPRISTSYEVNPRLRFNMALGWASKSASLSHRYPGPVYSDISLIKYYTNNPKENLYLVHTEVINPNNNHLGSSKSNTFEIGFVYTDKLINTALYYYAKSSSNGFAVRPRIIPLTLPIYDYTPIDGQKPSYWATSQTKNYPIRYSEVINGISSQNNGLELTLSTKKIKSIATSFSLSTAYTRSTYYSDFDAVFIPSVDLIPWDKEAVLGIYDNGESVGTNIKSTFTTNTHIPKLALIIGLIGEVYWMDKTEFRGASKYPTAYLDKNFNEFPISTSEVNDSKYSHLIASVMDREATSSNGVPFIYPNFHLRITKEIKNKIRFSFNAYNVFNYRPSYLNATETALIVLNQEPNFGAEISIKW